MSYNCLNILKWTEAQLKYTYDVSLQEATPQELHEALGDAVMMAISDNWNRSKRTRMHQRKAYYFSAEYLIGRLVYSNLYNLGILDEMKQLFAERGVDLAILEDIEDAALGNGGLGRLAACFLDSAASTDMPLSGYGLRYKFGLFKQSFDENGSQKENADDWSKNAQAAYFESDVPANLHAFERALSYAKPMVMSGYVPYAQTTNVITEALTNIYNGTYSVEEAWTDAQNQLNEVIDEKIK